MFRRKPFFTTILMAMLISLLFVGQASAQEPDYEPLQPLTDWNFQPNHWNLTPSQNNWTAPLNNLNLGDALNNLQLPQNDWQPPQNDWNSLQDDWQPPLKNLERYLNNSQPPQNDWQLPQDNNNCDVKIPKIDSQGDVNWETLSICNQQPAQNDWEQEIQAATQASESNDSEEKPLLDYDYDTIRERMSQNFPSYPPSLTERSSQQCDDDDYECHLEVWQSQQNDEQQWKMPPEAQKALQMMRDFERDFERKKKEFESDESNEHEEPFELKPLKPPINRERIELPFNIPSINRERMGDRIRPIGDLPSNYATEYRERVEKSRQLREKGILPNPNWHQEIRECYQKGASLSSCVVGSR